MMPSKFRTKHWILMICVVIIVVLFGGLVYAIQGESLARLLGKQQADLLTNAGDDIVATFDGEEITKKGFDTYKLFVNSGSNKLSDKEILDKIIYRQIEYKQALKEGIVVTDKDVDAFIKSAQESIKLTDESYAAFKDYIIGMSMTEEQYWESVRPAYQKALICGKFKNKLKEEFSKEKNINDARELNELFKEYYEQYIRDLISKVKVKSYLE